MGREITEGVAADVGKDGRVGVAGDGRLDRFIRVRVRTADAELRRAAGDLVEGTPRERGKGEGRADGLGRKLPGSGQRAGEAAGDILARKAEKAADGLLDERGAFLGDEDRFNVVDEAARFSIT